MMKRMSGMTLLELLLVLAIGSALLTATVYLLNTGISAYRILTAEAETRQALDHALQEIGRAVRETQEVHVPSTVKLLRDDVDPSKNPLALALSPTLDANADGDPDADNDRDGVLDSEVRVFIGPGEHPLTDITITTPLARWVPFPLRNKPMNRPRDMTNDSQAGIVGVDDDGQGGADELDAFRIWHDGTIYACDPPAATNDETTCDYWHYAKTDITEKNDKLDWLDVMVFSVIQDAAGGNVLVQRQPTPKAVDGTKYTQHVLARNVTKFTVERHSVNDAGKWLRERIEVRLCIAVTSPALAGQQRSACARRVWRVGGGA